MKIRSVLLLSTLICSLGFNFYSLSNALTFDLFVQNDQLNLVIKGTQTEKTLMKLSTGSNEFVLQSFCPTDCAAC